MTVATSKESSTFTAVPDEKSLSRQTTYNAAVAEVAVLDEKIKSPNSIEDFKVDVTEFANPSMDGPSGAMDADATECSSSFGDTASRSDYTSGTSDAEVESEFWGENAMASMFNNYDSILPTRKKKITTHWRSFVRPLMWRCKWTELRIKELKAQAKKYSKELEVNEQTKMLELDQYASEFCLKSFPFLGHGVKRKYKKRRMRKQVEKLNELASFTSHHQLFSYLENKKSDLDSTSTVDDLAVTDPISKHDEFAPGDEWFSGDETFLEQILAKIETVHSQVYKLRNNLDMVMLKNGMKLSSSENLSLISPFDGQASSAYSPAISAGNEDVASAGAIYTQRLSDFEMGDLALPEVISGCGIVPEIPDIIESTVGLLSAADVTIHQAHIESAENILEDALIQNNADQDNDAFNRMMDESFELELQLQLQLEPDEHNSSFLPLAELIPEPIVEIDVPEEKPTLTSCLTSEFHIPKAKRKRGERKAGPCVWNL